MADKLTKLVDVTCVECGAVYQAYYQTKISRCPVCRKKRSHDVSRACNKRSRAKKQAALKAAREKEKRHANHLHDPELAPIVLPPKETWKYGKYPAADFRGSFSGLDWLASWPGYGAQRESCPIGAAVDAGKDSDKNI